MEQPESKVNTQRSPYFVAFCMNTNWNMPASDNKELPKCLKDLLATLMENNTLRSWQIYGEKVGVTLKIRFGGHNNGSQDEPGNGTKVCFTKKSPARMKRDNQRIQEKRVTRSKSKELAAENVELPRNGGEGGMENSHDISQVSQTGILSPVHVPDPVNHGTPNSPSLHIDQPVSPPQMSEHNSTQNHMDLSLENILIKEDSVSEPNTPHQLDRSFQLCVPPNCLPNVDNHDNRLSCHSDSDVDGTDSDGHECHYSHNGRRHDSKLHKCLGCGTYICVFCLMAAKCHKECKKKRIDRSKTYQ